MARRKLFLSGILALASLTASTGVVAAAGDGTGASVGAPGQAGALANCYEAYQRQAERGVAAQGGPKLSPSAPLNCDHYWPVPAKR